MIVSVNAISDCRAFRIIDIIVTIWTFIQILLSSIMTVNSSLNFNLLYLLIFSLAVFILLFWLWKLVKTVLQLEKWYLDRLTKVGYRKT
jgi:hypothetical protein